jgi:hypothetical protein
MMIFLTWYGRIWLGDFDFRSGCEAGPLFRKIKSIRVQGSVAGPGQSCEFENYRASGDNLFATTLL